MRPLQSSQWKAPLRRGAGRFRIYNYGIEQIATTRHRLDDLARVITQSLANFANALDEGIVSHEKPAPDSLDQLFFRNQPPCVFGEIAEHVEGLRAERDFFFALQQRATHQIERIAVELESPW